MTSSFHDTYKSRLINGAIEISLYQDFNREASYQIGADWKTIIDIL
jgi:hypothetical protein